LGLRFSKAMSNGLFAESLVAFNNNILAIWDFPNLPTVMTKFCIAIAVSMTSCAGRKGEKLWEACVSGSLEFPLRYCDGSGTCAHAWLKHHVY
jgi:hypothetical protein